MSKPITAYGFKGMNNFPGAPAKLLDDERQITPQIVLNANVTDGGVLERRKGYQQVVNLANCHSLWAGSIMLCVADGVEHASSLWRIVGESAQELCEVTGPRARVSYEEIDSIVYASNSHWQATYDLLGDTVRSWGVSLPPAPAISLVAGDLSPGVYALAYTNVEEGRLGGNGPLIQVRWEGESAGLQLQNLPSGGLCWITHPNGGKLFLASISGGVVSGPQLQPLPSFEVTPPPGFTHFVYAFGRIWGARGKQVLYSDPHQYEWFRAGNFFPFLEDLVMLAPVSEGLFVNSLKSTWFLEGTDPAKMVMNRIGDGAIPGTLTFAQMSGANVGGGYEISRRLAQLPSPVWVAPRGIVVGTHTGHLVHLTEARLRIDPKRQGSGLYRVQDGIPQVITSFYGAGGTNNDLTRIFEEGQIFN